MTLFKLWNKIRMTVHYALYCELSAVNSSNIWILKIRNNILGQDQKVSGTFCDFSGLFHDVRSNGEGRPIWSRGRMRLGLINGYVSRKRVKHRFGCFPGAPGISIWDDQASSLCKFPEIDISPLKIGRNRSKRKGSSSNHSFSRAFAASFRKGKYYAVLPVLGYVEENALSLKFQQICCWYPGYSPVGCHCFRLNVGWRKSVWHNWRSTERITRHAAWGVSPCDFRVGISVRFFSGWFLDFLASPNFVVGSWAFGWWVGDIANSWCLAWFDEIFSWWKLHLWDFDSSFVLSPRLWLKT